MLDVLHYLFETDMIPSWENSAEIKDKVRSTISQSLYGKPYKYGMSGSNSTPMRGQEYDMPMSNEVKPYFPPSTEDELQAVLGPPVG